MNNSTNSGLNPRKQSLFAKKPVRLALSLFVIVVIASSMVFWAKGSREEKQQDVAAGSVKSQQNQAGNKTDNKDDGDHNKNSQTTAALDTMHYNKLVRHITNGDSSGNWPVKAGYPKDGAILPFKRIIAFYGNLYSKRMGILGELPPKQMLAKLNQEVANWQKADSTVEVIPALHYIAATAQLQPGKGGKYRLRMPFHQIDSVLSIAKQINSIVFLDIQIGLSTLQEEIPALEKYLLMPHVHLGIDPEFSMKGGHAPGKKVGSFDAADINYASSYLADLVTKNNLPPKILIVHRFTQGMLTNYKKITKRPEIQIVVEMDGWGERARKLNTHQQYIYKEPVQWTGFKIFYKNDTKAGDRIFTPAELLKLKPQPVYIQYQ